MVEIDALRGKLLDYAGAGPLAPAGATRLVPCDRPVPAVSDMIRIVFSLFLALIFAVPATASGTATGYYRTDGQRIDFAHAIALDQDNTEGLLQSARQLRVVLSDIEVPITALHGIAFPGVLAMARAGQVRGLLLEFDPAERTAMRITILAKPDDPHGSLLSLIVSNSEGVWSALALNADQVSGTYRSKDEQTLMFEFDASLLENPVCEDIQGAQVRSTEVIKALIARAEALKRGDIDTAVKLTAEVGRPALTALSAEARTAAAISMPDLLAQLKRSKRVVERHASAVAILDGGSWASVVLEDGKWMVSD